MEARVKTAVILVGGAGLRMRPLTKYVPKCMIPLHGKPLLYWSLDWLKNTILSISFWELPIAKKR